MDEAENKGTTDVKEAAKGAAKEAANEVKEEASKALGEIRGRGVMGFFSFDKFYFPIIARFLFIVVVVLSVIGIVLGMLGGLITLFSSPLAGIGTIIMAPIMGVLGIIGTRIWFEFILLGFKLNENVEKIRDK